MAKDKVQSIDILRGIGALAVIAIHITATSFTYPLTSNVYLIFGIINKFCNFAVPLFLFISALVLMKNTKEAGELKVGKFYLKRAIKVLIPYLIWTIIYLSYLKYIGGLNGVISFKRVISYLCLGGAYYHLYFIPIIIQMYLIFPIIWFALKKKEPKIPRWISFCIIFIILELLQFAFLRINITYIYQYFKNSAVIVFSYMLPIGMGLWIGYNWDGWKSMSKIVKGIVVLLTIVTGYCFIRRQLFNNWGIPIYTMPMLYMTLVSMTLLIFAEWLSKSENLVKKFLLSISKESFFIYLSHPLILSFLAINLKWGETNVTNSAFANYSIDFVCRYIAVFSGAYLLAKLTDYIKKLVCCNIKGPVIK